MQGSEYKNAHRTRYPQCLEKRYLSDGKTERRKMYYFPFKEWYQDIFTKPDLSRHMANDLPPEEYPSGHVRRSDGWREKVARETTLCILS